MIHVPNFMLHDCIHFLQSNFWHESDWGEIELRNHNTQSVALNFDPRKQDADPFIFIHSMQNVLDSVYFQRF